MSNNKITPSLLKLTVELVYRILDNLDQLTILLSLRNVCTRLNVITDTYHRYQVNVSFILKSDFHHLRSVIHFNSKSNLPVLFYVQLSARSNRISSYVISRLNIASFKNLIEMLNSKLHAAISNTNKELSYFSRFAVFHDLYKCKIQLTSFLSYTVLCMNELNDDTFSFT